MIPSRSEYYGEEYRSMSLDDKMDISYLEGRHATGLLWRAARHIKADDRAAYELIHELRDQLIDNEIELGDDSDTAKYRTLFLYRMNTVGIPPRSDQ